MTSKKWVTIWVTTQIQGQDDVSIPKLPPDDIEFLKCADNTEISAEENCPLVRRGGRGGSSNHYTGYIENAWNSEGHTLFHYFLVGIKITYQEVQIGQEVRFDPEFLVVPQTLVVLVVLKVHLGPTVQVDLMDQEGLWDLPHIAGVEFYHQRTKYSIGKSTLHARHPQVWDSNGPNTHSLQFKSQWV